MTVHRHAQLWGGPMDGASVFMGDGPLPHRVGMHVTADGALIPLRTRALQGDLTQHRATVEGLVQVYERAGLTAMALIRSGMTPWLARLDDQAPLYVHRDLLIRWQSQGQM